MAGDTLKEFAIMAASLPPSGEIRARLGTQGQAGGKKGMAEDLLAEAA